MGCRFIPNCQIAKEIGDSIFSSDNSLYIGECVGQVPEIRREQVCNNYRMFKRVEGILERTGEDLAEYYPIGTMISPGRREMEARG